MECLSAEDATRELLEDVLLAYLLILEDKVFFERGRNDTNIRYPSSTSKARYLAVPNNRRSIPEQIGPSQRKSLANQDNQDHQNIELQESRMDQGPQSTKATRTKTRD